MLKKINCYIFLITMATCLTIGLIFKHSHKNIKDDINDFYVGLLDENLVNTEINIMKKNLHNSNYILLVTCEDEIQFDFSFGSQKVKIDSVIKGNNDVSEGDIIDIIKINHVFTSMKAFNINFTNELKIGSQYLIFLDECVTLNNHSTVFIHNVDYFVSPYFSIDEINAAPVKPEAPDPDNFSAKYGNVKNQDVFMMSSEAIQQWEQFRKEIIETYIQ